MDELKNEGIESIKKFMAIIDMQTKSMQNIVITLKVCGARITQLEQEIDELKLQLNALTIVNK